MKTTLSTIYRNYPINVGWEGNLPCNILTLDQLIASHEYMLCFHSKVLFVRLDIRSPRWSISPLRVVMARILESSKRILDSKNRGKNRIDMHYVWTAEQKDYEGKEHAHLAIWVNGNAIQNGYRVLEAVKEAVERQFPGESKGLVHFCQSTGEKGILIDRNDPYFEKISGEIIYVASYLAKISTKEHRPKGGRFSSASRLPSDWR